MSHNIFNDRFYSLREPAWHGLGQVSEIELGAQEAFSQLTPYDLELRQLQISTTGGMVEVPLRAIMRTPTPDDPEERFFGSVGMEYELITPQQICEIYDRVIHEPVETVGALGRGEVFFLSTKMKSSRVVGDAIDNYLIVDAGMSGNEAANIRIASVRPVCQNTLIASRRRTVQSYRVKHTKGALNRFAEWLEYAFGESKENLKLINQFFGAFAKVKVSDEAQAQEILELTYPNPRAPRLDAPKEVLESRLENYQYNLQYQQQTRSLAYELFQGAGTGQDTKAAAGTMWGLYNAVVELEDYRGAGRGARNTLARQRDAVFGWRADNKERCFNAIVAEIGLAE